MSATVEVIIVLGVFLVLLSSGMGVPIAIAIPAVLFLFLEGGTVLLNSLGFISWGSLNSFTLTAIPLFLLMAEILTASGLSNRIYEGLSKLVAPLPGGLMQTNIAGCAVFASVSGSSVATAASIGRVALPQLTSRGYSRRVSAGSLVAGGTLGILIPPSIPMIIYGTFTHTSVPQLFMAGLVPGLVLTFFFMLYIGAYALIYPESAPSEKRVGTVRELLRAIADTIPFIVLMGVTLGSLYGGYATTTEAATIGCLCAVVLGYVFGDLKFSGVVKAIRNSILITGNILFLVLAAYILSAAISLSGVGVDLVNAVHSLDLSRLEFIILLFVLYIVLGCFIESLGMIVLTVPLVFPMLSAYDIDPLLFGVLLVVFVELAQMTPPMGMNLFIVQSIWDGKLKDVIIGALPFCLITLFMAAILMAIPEIVLWLPSKMFVR